jgi:hypothetical protein
VPHFVSAFDISSVEPDFSLMAMDSMGNVPSLGSPPPSEIMPGMASSGCRARMADGFRAALTAVRYDA